MRRGDAVARIAGRMSTTLPPPPLTTDASVREIVRRVEKIRLRALSAEMLRGMEAEVAAEQETLRQRAIALEAESRAHLLAGHGSPLEGLRRAIRGVGRQFEELEDDRVKIANAYQERVLEDGLVQRLGSLGRVRLLEGVVLALISLVLGLLMADFTLELQPETKRLFFWIDTACCVVFLAEFSLRHRCAESKRWFWKHHFIDFITSIPIPDAQVLRFGRVARVARIARVARFVRLLRVLRVVFFFWRGMDKLGDVLDVKMMKKSLLLGLIILIAGAAMIQWAEAEKNPEAMEGFTDSLWWSFTTVVTGGFGDIHNPETATGQVVTVLLVIAGMVVVGIFTATLTSVLVGDDSEQLALMQSQLVRKLDDLEAHIDALAAASTPDAPTTATTDGDASEPTGRDGDPAPDDAA